MAVGGVLLFDDAPGARYERVLERVAKRLHLIPRYRQRLQEPAGLNPVWVDDETSSWSGTCAAQRCRAWGCGA